MLRSIYGFGGRVVFRVRGGGVGLGVAFGCKG